MSESSKETLEAAREKLRNASAVLVFTRNQEDGPIADGDYIRLTNEEITALSQARPDQPSKEIIDWLYDLEPRNGYTATVGGDPNNLWVDVPIELRDAIIAALSQAHPALFQTGSFALHSGQVSDFLIDCEALSDKELAALSDRARQIVGPFSSVVGIPRGGLRFSEAMRKYETPHQGPRLIVDDVLSTGRSMEEHRSGDDKGLVIFARGPVPAWVTALWHLSRPAADRVSTPESPVAVTTVSGEPRESRGTSTAIAEALERAADALENIAGHRPGTPGLHYDSLESLINSATGIARVAAEEARRSLSPEGWTCPKCTDVFTDECVADKCPYYRWVHAIPTSLSQARTEIVEECASVRVTPDVATEADAENPFQEGYAVGFQDCEYRMRKAIRSLSPEAGKITTEQLDVLQFGKLVHERPAGKKGGCE